MNSLSIARGKFFPHHNIDEECNTCTTGGANNLREANFEKCSIQGSLKSAMAIHSSERSFKFLILFDSLRQFTMHQ